MIQEFQIRVLPEQAADEQKLKEFIHREKGVNLKQVNAIRILKRSIDARQRTIFINLTLRVYINEVPRADYFTPIDYPNASKKEEVIVVGAGPGGLFAALRLIE